MNDLSVTVVGPRLNSSAGFFPRCSSSCRSQDAVLLSLCLSLSLSLGMIECNQLFLISLSLTAAFAVNMNGEDVESLLVEK